MTTAKDWRGNTYPVGTPLAAICGYCDAPAVRNVCKAEGDRGRAHWHGLVHVLEDGSWHLRALCASCCEKAQG